MEKYEVTIIGTYISRTIFADSKKECLKIAKDIFNNIPNPRFKCIRLEGYFN